MLLVLPIHSLVKLLVAARGGDGAAMAGERVVFDNATSFPENQDLTKVAQPVEDR